MLILLCVIQLLLTTILVNFYAAMTILKINHSYLVIFTRYLLRFTIKPQFYGIFSMIYLQHIYETFIQVHIKFQIWKLMEYFSKMQRFQHKYASSELFQPIVLNTIMGCYTLGLLCASHYAYESFAINKMEAAVTRCAFSLNLFHR